jgi:uncharacterized protein involved in outer membrane biogenesis
MKKLFIALGILLVLLVAAIIIIPIVLKEPITKAVKEEANANLNATINFKGVEISILRSFPDVYVGINELSITGKDKFEGRTLLYLKTLSLDVNLMSAFKGAPVINQITLADGLANVIVLEDGSANYDIVPESEGTEEEVPVEAETSAMAIKLKEFRISNLEVLYTDKQGGTNFSTSKLNLTLGGDFEADKTNFETDIAMENAKLLMGGVNYLNGVELAWKQPLMPILPTKLMHLRTTNSVSTDCIFLGMERLPCPTRRHQYRPDLRCRKDRIQGDTFACASGLHQGF